MAKVLQMRRGTTAQNDAFTGAEGELTVDTTAKTLRVHDGVTAGGTALAKKSEIPDISGKADKASLATVATTGAYNDLTGKPTLGALAAKDKVAYGTDITGTPTIPTVPTKVSAFENDKGYLTEHQSLAEYAKKTEIPTVPTKVSAFENDAGYLTQHQSLDAYATKASLKAVATSGSYNDLTDKPAVPTVDSALSSTSENPVQNKVVKSALDSKLDIRKPTAHELLLNYGQGGWLTLLGKDFNRADKGGFILSTTGPSLAGLPDGTLTWDGKSLIGVGFPNYSSYVTVSKGNFTPSENGWLRLYLSASGDYRSFAVTHKASGVVILNYGQARYPGYGWFMCPVVAGETYTIESSESQIYFHKMR